MKFTAHENRVLQEVKRRVETFKRGNKAAPMIYLGYPSEVQTLIKKGVLTPYSDELRRCKNWYNLTELGQTAI
jgi:hypothetical protein